MEKGILTVSPAQTVSEKGEDAPLTKILGEWLESGGNMVKNNHLTVSEMMMPALKERTMTAAE